MLALLVSAALVCAGAMLVGQLVLRLCGAPAWSWTAPAVGFAVLMLVSMTALHIPGGTVTTALALMALTVAGLVLAVREPAQRPPLTGLLAGIPLALMALVPFISTWRAGTLGVGFNNDMASHLLWAEAFQSEAVARLNPLSPHYPVGPHAVAAALAEGLGARIDFTFAGLTAALPVLLGWTALGALRATGLVRRTAFALVAGIPFIVAGYYGQGSFKELAQAMFALAVVLLLARPLLPTIWRWVPLGLLIAGTLSVYSAPGLAWPVPVIGAWLVVLLAIDVWQRGGVRHAVTVARENLLPLAAGIGVFILVLVPQIPRIARFIGDTADEGGTGIDDSSLGNLAGRIPLWPAFGTWDQPDYRLPAIDPFATGMWTAFVLGLVLLGATWCIRRGQWVIPLGALLFVALWAASDRSQSPYVAAKALVVVAPLLLLLAALPVVDVDPPGRAPRWWYALAPVLAVLLVGKVGISSWHALRISQVGPTAHAGELRALRGDLLGERVLFLGNDDFARWELAGVYLNGPVISFQTLPTRPEKPWDYARNLDFDSLPPEIYNEYDWVITPRDAAGSTPPEGLRLVRSTPTFDLYRRTGTVPARRVLAEGEASGRVLRCSTRAGAALARRDGVALVREPPVAVAVPQLGPGGRARVTLPLTPGVWDLGLPYTSQRPLTVRVAGRRIDLPASLDRPGVRLPAGTITVAKAGPVPVEVEVTENAATPKSATAFPSAVVATRRGTQRLVPLREACGRYVDWYRLGPR